jgi:ParB family transcriptional regulator, chromosome partitioning protein
MKLNPPIEIDIKLILPAEDNNRDLTLCTGKIQEYAISMEEYGVIQQLIARPHPEQEGFYQLRCGHLRLAAAKLVGLETVPVSINDFDDQQAVEITVLENLKSELTPYEESMGCSKLITSGWDVETVASHIGKSESWVRRRASLQGLSDKWLEMMKEIVLN